MIVRLTQLLDEQRLCDCEIEYGAHHSMRLRAHRVVLAAACPFFDSMFSSRMRDSNSEVIVVTLASREQKSIFPHFIRFLYSGDAHAPVRLGTAACDSVRGLDESDAATLAASDSVPFLCLAHLPALMQLADLFMVAPLQEACAQLAFDLLALPDAPIRGNRNGPQIDAKQYQADRVDAVAMTLLVATHLLPSFASVFHLSLECVVASPRLFRMRGHAFDRRVGNDGGFSLRELPLELLLILLRSPRLAVADETDVLRFALEWLASQLSGAPDASTVLSPPPPSSEPSVIASDEWVAVCVRVLAAVQFPCVSHGVACALLSAIVPQMGDVLPSCILRLATECLAMVEPSALGLHVLEAALRYWSHLLTAAVAGNAKQRCTGNDSSSGICSASKPDSIDTGNPALDLALSAVAPSPAASIHDADRAFLAQPTMASLLARVGVVATALASATVAPSPLSSLTATLPSASIAGALSFKSWSPASVSLLATLPEPRAAMRRVFCALNVRACTLRELIRAHENSVFVVLPFVHARSGVELVCTASSDLTVRIWCETAATNTGPSLFSSSASLSSDRGNVSGGNDLGGAPASRRWQCVGRLEGHADWVTSLCIVGDSIVTGSADAAIGIWRDVLCPRTRASHPASAAMTAAEATAAISSATAGGFDRDKECRTASDEWSWTCVKMLSEVHSDTVRAFAVYHAARVEDEAVDAEAVVDLAASASASAQSHRYLLSGSYDGTIAVLDASAATGDRWHCARVLRGHRSGVMALIVRYAPANAARAAACHVAHDAAWTVAHPSDADFAGSLSGGGGRSSGSAPRASGGDDVDVLFSAGFDRTVCVWALSGASAGACLRRVTLPGKITSLIALPHRTVTASADPTVAASAVSSMASGQSASGARSIIAAGCDDGHVYLLRVIVGAARGAGVAIAGGGGFGIGSGSGHDGVGPALVRAATLFIESKTKVQTLLAVGPYLLCGTTRSGVWVFADEGCTILARSTSSSSDKHADISRRSTSIASARPAANMSAAEAGAESDAGGSGRGEGGSDDGDVAGDDENDQHSMARRPSLPQFAAAADGPGTWRVTRKLPMPDKVHHLAAHGRCLFVGKYRDVEVFSS